MSKTMFSTSKTGVRINMQFESNHWHCFLAYTLPCFPKTYARLESLHLHSDKRLRMDIYAINESDEDLILDHTSNGVARHVAAVKLSIGDKTYELQGRPEGWERAHLSRSIRPGFRTIAAAKKGQPTKFHLGEFDAEWSKELVEHAKKLSGKEAKLEVGMTLRVVNAQKTTVKPPEATTIKLPKKMVLPG